MVLGMPPARWLLLRSLQRRAEGVGRGEQDPISVSEAKDNAPPRLMMSDGFQSSSGSDSELQNASNQDGAGTG